MERIPSWLWENPTWSTLHLLQHAVVAWLHPVKPLAKRLERLGVFVIVELVAVQPSPHI